MLAMTQHCFTTLRALRQARVNRVAQRLLARIVAQVEPHPVHHVRERELARRVGERERSTGAGMPERGVVRAELERIERARKAERERRVDLEHLVVPALA